MLPTSTQLKIESKSSPGKTDAVVVFLPESDRLTAPAVLSTAQKRVLTQLWDARATTGKGKEVVFGIVDDGGEKSHRLYVVGLGSAEKMTADTVRQCSASGFRALRSAKIGSASFIVPEALADFKAADLAEALALGAALAAFEFEEFKGTGQKPEERESRKSLQIHIVSADKSIKLAVERGIALAESQNFARTIASRPGNVISPPTLAAVAVDLAKEVGLRCRIMDEKELAKLKMGGILAVGAGSSATPPRMIVLEYNGLGKKSKGNGKPILIVGKAITFDTGGISIKGADRMGKMIYDKSGGTAVLGAMCALAKLKIPAHVIGILASAENGISELAYRPGDILRMYNGVTVEVTNTDAEGRLVLGDALAWGIETYKPRAVVDLATLTGGVITALGCTMAGVMGNNDALIDQLTSAGEFAGEKMWRLPLGPDQREQIKSHHADIVNSAGREGHPLQGGAFLSYFIPTDDSVPWAHLDIAGVADIDKELPYYAKGSTGWGVRTLVEWINRSSQTK